MADARKEFLGDALSQRLERPAQVHAVSVLKGKVAEVITNALVSANLLRGDDSQTFGEENAERSLGGISPCILLVSAPPLARVILSYPFPTFFSKF